MIDYLKTRLTQPSTWLGIASSVVTIAMSGWILTPDSLGALLAAIGLIHIDETK